MKTLFILFILSFIFLKDILSQSLIQRAEILFRNSSSQEINVVVYPVSAVFSGFSAPLTDESRKYSLKRSNSENDPYWTVGPNNTKYITGGSRLIIQNDYKVIDFDDGQYYNLTDSNDKVIGGISYGLWKFEIYHAENGVPGEELIEYFYLDERDFNHGIFTPSGFYTDLYITFVDTADNLYFNFVGGNMVSIYDSAIVDKTIKAWHKVGVNSPIYGQDPIIPGSPNKGLYKSFSEFTEYPVYSTEYGAIKHENAGSINLNLNIDHDIATRDTLLESITNIRIESKTLFKINDGKIFHMITPSYPSGGYTNLIIGEDSAKLQLRPNSQIIADPPNRITLKNGGFLLKNPGSRITINPGAYLCNEGGSIRGSGCLLRRSGCC